MELDPIVAAQAKVAAAAGAGALVRLYFRPAEGLLRTSACFACSIIFAIYATPVMIELWGLSSDSTIHGVTAAIGLFGLSIAEMFLRGFDRFDLAAFVRRRFNG